jgi:hypothetical protein
MMQNKVEYQVVKCKDHVCILHASGVCAVSCGIRVIFHGVRTGAIDTSKMYLLFRTLLLLFLL